MNKITQKTSGTETTQISLASQVMYPPALMPAINLGAGNITDTAKPNTNTRGNQ
ncbi:MAG: hypothetical protein JEZ11_15305 [Desulfobacterales bacterium]|nr:hypothetical protein [Desulfobacterales bacterium]